VSGKNRRKERPPAGAPVAVVTPVDAVAEEVLRCELCPSTFPKGMAALRSHVPRAHRNMPWKEYEAKYLAPDLTAAPEAGTETSIEKSLGIAIDPDRLRQALTHRSYAYENGGLPTNERLEFLGDSVLGLVVTTALYGDHPTLPEGRLAKLRASVVNSRALAEVARTLGLGPHLLLGRGEETTGGRDKESILADTLEAVLGAIYLQYDLSVAAEVVHRLFDPVMAQAARLGAGLDWKTSLQELTATRALGVPDYHIEQTGPDHAKTFTAWAVVAGERFGGVQGRTKKDAEQKAAEAAFLALTADDGPEDADEAGPDA
jgi:ribonuclease-3